MSTAVYLKHSPELTDTEIFLPASKSESNRALIIHALAGGDTPLHNISEARDTQTMQRLLNSTEKELDVLDAGTTMRFLTAYCAVQGMDKIIKGTPRMHERPIKLLVDALRELGAKIEYLQNEGYPPLHIQGFEGQKTNKVQIQGDVSSQYISALLMIAPKLPDGLYVELTGHIGSRPYIEMTLRLMKHFGAKSTWEGNVIHVPHQNYSLQPYTIESDWSGASYWYSLVALAEKAKITLKGLRKNSLQGDIKIVEIMQGLGVQTEFVEDGVVLTKSKKLREIEADYADCPDLAQTVAVACSVSSTLGIMTGLESLRIKETDRIFALEQELEKIGARLIEDPTGEWHLNPTTIDVLPTGPVQFETYEDHRMAMAIAPLATKMDIIIEDPEVVNKSYPNFWKDLEKAGIKIEQKS